MQKVRPMKPLRRFDYGLIRERLDGLLINVDRDLQRRGSEAHRSGHRDEERCLLLLNLFIRFAINSYNAVRYVAGDTPEDPRRKSNYVMVLPAINRQLLDILFSLVYMLDDLSGRSLRYQRAGWRELYEQYQFMKSHFSKDPEWKNHFQNVKGVLERLVAEYGITAEDRKDPKLVPFWKHPFELKDEKTASRPFLRYLEKWLYADTSAQAHFSFGGLVMVAPFLVAEIVGGEDAEIVNSRIIQQYRYIHLSRTALVALAIATEIDAFCKLGNSGAADYLWNIFAEYSAEAKEMVEYRYGAIFAKDGGPVIGSENARLASLGGTMPELKNPPRRRASRG